MINLNRINYDEKIKDLNKKKTSDLQKEIQKSSQSISEKAYILLNRQTILAV